MDAVKEHPILFKGEMVRAILDGTKFQTRRLIKLLKRPSVIDATWDEDWQERARADHGCLFHGVCLHVPFTFDSDEQGWERLPCRYQPGDFLWVKETWQKIGDYPVCYGAGQTGCGSCETHTWRPSIFMKRAFSRIDLKVLSAKIEHVQDISEEDARAEGATPCFWYTGGGRLPEEEHQNLAGDGLKSQFEGTPPTSYRNGFANLWDSIHSRPKPVLVNKKIDHYVSYPWDGERETREHRGRPWYINPNPWIAAYEFERVRP